MHHELKRIEMEPLPEATVVYIPETDTLYIENGRLREDAEEMADGVLVYYDKHDEASAVALCIEPAETGAPALRGRHTGQIRREARTVPPGPANRQIDVGELRRRCAISQEE